MLGRAEVNNDGRCSAKGSPCSISIVSRVFDAWLRAGVAHSGASKVWEAAPAWGVFYCIIGRVIVCDSLLFKFGFGWGQQQQQQQQCRRRQRL
jgi:hypothetical protein